MKKLVPILIAVAMMLPGTVCAQGKSKTNSKDAQGLGLIDQVIGLIDQNYMTTTNTTVLSEMAVTYLLHQLDPHSLYIPANEVKRQKEALSGKYAGIGLYFQVMNDSIWVTDVSENGPADKAGIRLGDMVLSVNGAPATGDSIDNRWFQRQMKSKMGDENTLVVARGNEILTLTLKRDKVPMNSIDRCFMANDSIGYIRLSSFTRTSVSDLRQALRTLEKSGMTALIVDLRGNTGGYFDAALNIASEFLDKNKLIAYTIDRSDMRSDYRTSPRGNFREGRMAVLIDENTASASEVLTGALQDWNRAVVVGQRSFGKGLVSSVYELKNGGEIRLSTARYYTPSGRSLQRPYTDNLQLFNEELLKGPQAIRTEEADTESYETYQDLALADMQTTGEGGGIEPDVHVEKPAITKTQQYQDLVKAANLWALRWANRHRAEYSSLSAEGFMEVFPKLDLYSKFAKENPTADNRDIKGYLEAELEGYVLKGLYGIKYYYLAAKESDDAFQMALQQLEK